MFAALLISLSLCCSFLRGETIVKDAPANFTAIATNQYGQKVPVSGEMDTIQILDVHRQGDKTYDPGLSIDINVRPLNDSEQWQSTSPARTYELPGPGGTQPPQNLGPGGTQPPQNLSPPPSIQPPVSPTPPSQPPNYPGTSKVQNLTPLQNPSNPTFTDISNIRTTDNAAGFQTNYPYTAGGLAPTNPSTSNFNIPSLAPSNFQPAPPVSSTPMPFNPFGLPTNIGAQNNFFDMFRSNATQGVAAPGITSSIPFPWLTGGANTGNGFSFGNQFGIAPKKGYGLFGEKTGRTGGPNPGDSYFENGILNNTSSAEAGKSNTTNNATLTDLLMNWLYKGNEVNDYNSEDYDYDSPPLNETKVPLTYETAINPAIYESYFQPSQWNKFTNVTYPDNSSRSGSRNPAHPPKTGAAATPWNAVSMNNPWFKLNDIRKLPTTDFASFSFSQAGQNPPQWSFNASGPDVMEFFKNSTDFNMSSILQDLNMTFKDPMAWTNDMAGVSTVNVEQMPTIFEIDNYGKPINISEIMESVEKALQNLTGATKNNSLDYGTPADMYNMFTSVDVGQLLSLPSNNTFKPTDLSRFNTLSNYSASYGNLTKNNITDKVANGTRLASETNATSSVFNDQPADEQNRTTSMDGMLNMPDMSNMNHDGSGYSSQNLNAAGLEAAGAGVALTPSWLTCIFVFAGLLGRSWSA